MEHHLLCSKVPSTALEGLDSHCSHFADKWTQAQRAKTTHRINVKAWTESQIHLTPRFGLWL